MTEAKRQVLRDKLPALEHRYHAEEVAHLPPPVRRYLSFAIHDGQLLAAMVTLEQSGEILLPGGWRRFTAASHVRVNPPGFLWDARVRLLPGVSAWVRDGYLGGSGSMEVALGGWLPLISAPPSAEITVAALQRYLAEGPWAPQLLLPSAGVEWHALDDHSASATLQDGTTTVSVDFRFGPGGEIVEVETDRYRSLAGRQVLTHWIGRFADYRRVTGIMIPRRGEVGWVTADGWEPYWRGSVLAVQAGPE